MRLPKRGPSLKSLLAPESHASNGAFLFSSDQAIKDLVARANSEGWNWEDCSHRAAQAGMTAEQFWVAVKFSRSLDRIAIPLRDTKGQPFTYRLTPSMQRMLHRIDVYVGGFIGGTTPELETESTRARYLLSSLREEAIHSSLIEGAVVTRADAVEMLRTQRKPRDKSEQMVFNNYLTIRMLNDRRREPMTIRLLCEVQKLLTDETLDEPAAAGQFRTEADSIHVVDEESNEVVHFPPSAAEIPERMKLLCEYANRTEDFTSNEFDHPVIRAIILHFWLAYDHPFVDGNGRTARALFYWSMLRQKYWLTEYLTISTIISRQPKQYYRAFLDTEYDENDLSYFLIYHLQVIDKSIAEFQKYLKHKSEERAEWNIISETSFNERQKSILERAVKQPKTIFTNVSHANSQGIAINTAKADLETLRRRGLLKRTQKGKAFAYIPVPDIEARLRKLSKRK